MLKTTKKYALIGTSCVGKTTLILKLKNLLIKEFPKKKIEIAEEAARIYFAKNKAKNPFSYFHQNKIQNLAKQQEQTAYKNNADIVLCDRSVIDAIVYVKSVGDKNGSEKLTKKVKEWLLTYTHFFLLDPKDIPYSVDDIRKESKKTRELFHKTFLKILSSIKLPYTLILGNETERLNNMLRIINKND